MLNNSKISGNQNIVIQGVTESSIVLNINGETSEINKRLDSLQALFLEKIESKTIQSADKIYNIGAITNANFDFIIDQSKNEKTLPLDLAQNMVTDENRWVQSLRQELLGQGVSVGNKPWAIFQHYGWLIEAFLQKMGTPIGQERTLRRLSFMAEAFQSTLRFLSYIQLTQLLQKNETSYNEVLLDSIHLKENQYQNFDYLNLLLLTSDILKEEKVFIPEIKYFVAELSDTSSDLYGTALFLEKYRNELLENNIPKDEKLNQLLDEYLTGLVYWLRKISFLAKYRLMSIKDISLNYRMGTPKNFVHLYGELHGMYREAYTGEEDYNAFSIEGEFTFNQSVLLFKGSNVESCLEKIADSTTYISLSPLVIDFSVYSEKKTQTPEIFYYIGKDSSGRQYRFAQYKNELSFDDVIISSNKEILVKAQNNQHPKLDDLYVQLEQVFKPFIYKRK